MNVTINPQTNNNPVCPVKRHNTSSILSYPRELKKSKQMFKYAK
jgi:hypothetical protein